MNFPKLFILFAGFAVVSAVYYENSRNCECSTYNPCNCTECPNHPNCIPSATTTTTLAPVVLDDFPYYSNVGQRHVGTQTYHGKVYIFNIFGPNATIPFGSSSFDRPAGRTTTTRPAGRNEVSTTTQAATRPFTTHIPILPYESPMPEQHRESQQQGYNNNKPAVVNYGAPQQHWETMDNVFVRNKTFASSLTSQSFPFRKQFRDQRSSFPKFDNMKQLALALQFTEVLPSADHHLVSPFGDQQLIRRVMGYVQQTGKR